MEAQNESYNLVCRIHKEHLKSITFKIVDDSLQRRLSQHKLFKQRNKIEDEILQSEDNFLKMRLGLELKEIDDDLDKLPRDEYKDVLKKRQGYLRASSIELKKTIEQRITFLIDDIEDIDYLTPEDEVIYVNKLIDKCEKELLNKYFRKMIRDDLKEIEISKLLIKQDIDKVIISNDPRFRFALSQKDGKKYSDSFNKYKIAGTIRAEWKLRLLEIVKELGFTQGETVYKEEKAEILDKMKNVRNGKGKKITLTAIKRELSNLGYSDPSKDKQKEVEPQETIYQLSKIKNKPPKY